MAYRITSSDDTVQQIRSVPISATTGAAIRCDSTAVTTDVTFCVWVYFESDPGVDADYGIFKTYTSANTNHFSLNLKRSASGATWQLGGYFKGASLGFPYTFPSSPIGKWYLVAFQYRYRAGTSNDYTYMTIHDPVAGTTTLGYSGVSTAAGSVPDLASIGNFRTTGDTGTQRNVLGIVIPAIITGQFIVDGSTQDGTTTTSLATLATNKGLAGHVTHANCVWAANYAGGAFYGTSDSGYEDNRAGNVLASDGSAFPVFDANAATLPNYHQLGRGATVLGTITAVNPYLYGTISYPVPTDTTVGASASPATTLTLAASGRRDANLTKLANWINAGTGSGQLRVGTFGNSRAGYPQLYKLRLTDGTFPGRKMMTNFTDMGLLGQADLWNGGHIVGMTVPVPCNNWTTSANTLDGAYGVDCEAGLLRCKDSGGTVVNPSAVFTVMTDTTLGTRLTMTARAANTPPSTAGSSLNAYGAGNSVRLAPDCTARWMIRPELGLPVTDPLTITLRFINHPNSASISSVRKVIGTSQNGVESSSEAVTAPGLGQSTSPAPVGTIPITGVSPASLTNQVTHADYGYITVDDSSNNFADLEVGDLVQLHDPLGATDVYNEAFVVYAVTGQGTTDCNIYYEWIPRQAPSVGDLVSFIKGQTILQEVTVTFDADEAADGEWRGIEVVADSDGDGVLIYEIEFNNPSGTGIHPVAIGRTGCGAWIQAARWPRVADNEGLSLSERHFANWDLDVIVLTTADQGTAGSNYVASYDTLIDYVQADAPSASIVLYSTGPEWTGEGTKDKSDVGDKYDWAACLQYAAAAAGLPHTAYLFSRYTSAFGRLMAADDTTESPTHPSCVLDVAFLGAQLDGLQSEATSLNHGFGGRRRSPLRYRG